MRYGVLISLAVLALGAGHQQAQAGGLGTSPGLASDGTYSNWTRSNHPYPWQYPSTYPFSTPVVYTAGPGAYYPAKRYRRHVARHGQRWTGYPPRHFYVVSYNGYAPQYGFPPGAYQLPGYHPYHDHYGYYR
ncbi:MAG TPA: hypothetical protein PLQ11_07215 [Beijerinckiaceae bacterium]|nr:hypothetical protein [Beijerinckiaceae bacterium]